MAKKKVRYPELEVEITKALAEYSREVAEGVQAEIENAAKELVQTLRKTSPKETGLCEGLDSKS